MTLADTQQQMQEDIITYCDDKPEISDKMTTDLCQIVIDNLAKLSDGG